MKKVAFKAFWFKGIFFCILTFILYIKDKEFCVTIDQGAMLLEHDQIWTKDKDEGDAEGGRGRLSQSLRLPRLNAKPASLQLSGVLPNSNENARTLLLHCNAAPMQCNSISGRGQFSFVQVGESVRVVSIRAFGALWTFRYHQFGLKMASLSFSISKYTLKMQSLFNLQKCKN